MGRFDERELDGYHGVRVNALADREGLTWDDRLGDPYAPLELIDRRLRPASERDLPREYRRLFDHTLRFKPRGSGRRTPVLAVSSPYIDDTQPNRALSERFATTYGLAVRFGDPRDVVYRTPGTVPILFWRADRHELSDAQ